MNNKDERQAWNAKHRELTKSIMKTEEHDQAVDLILSTQGLIYSSEMAGSLGIHGEDILFSDITEDIMRCYPVPCSDTRNSIVWHLWHIARVEDITMNILVAGGQQVLSSDNWTERMNIRFSHSGNDMNESEISELSSSIDIESLLAYRIAVGRQTRVIVKSLKPSQFREKIQSSRIQRLFDEQMLNEGSKWLAEYWSKKTIAGLFLMPTTRHNFLHMNKCIRIKNKIEKMNKKKNIV
ncbi:DinB family protein [Chengkuizengella axinellae]|uniref:DinB family protein n=1 Tax=Chengkuizengella axinellae TaxID=3064388 RepID=A0ABT9IZZ6_9BACL|nr:DinB family protein [Chengkuizengella sp. 2205SS18-9]MDP5274954.1 DinB family protein [Chengkuizengella sp. 2205SS18-9]